MESLGISTDDVWTLFMLIDNDDSGMVDIEEFVSGCMQLRGPAKSLQVGVSLRFRRFRAIVEHISRRYGSFQACEKHEQAARGCMKTGRAQGLIGGQVAKMSYENKLTRALGTRRVILYGGAQVGAPHDAA